MIAHAAALSALIAADSLRLRLLRHVAALGLPDCWIGAGFVRDAAWDHLHGRGPSPLAGDADVVWFDGRDARPETDRAIETALRATAPGIAWSVKNQARMHARNGDAPYASTADAVAHWPETATAVAMRLTEAGIQVLAPHGLADLFGLVLRPTPAFTATKLPIFLGRVREKRWLDRWPDLRLALPAPMFPALTG